MTEQSAQKGKADPGENPAQLLTTILSEALERQRSELQYQLRQQDEAVVGALREMRSGLPDSQSRLSERERAEVLDYEALRLTLDGPSTAAAAPARGVIAGFHPTSGKTGDHVHILLDNTGQPERVLFAGKVDPIPVEIEQVRPIESSSLLQIEVAVPRGAVDGPLTVIFENAPALQTKKLFRIGNDPGLIGA